MVDDFVRSFTPRKSGVPSLRARMPSRVARVTRYSTDWGSVGRGPLTGCIILRAAMTPARQAHTETADIGCLQRFCHGVHLPLLLVVFFFFLVLFLFVSSF